MKCENDLGEDVWCWLPRSLPLFLDDPLTPAHKPFWSYQPGCSLSVLGPSLWMRNMPSSAPSQMCTGFPSVSQWGLWGTEIWGT